MNSQEVAHVKSQLATIIENQDRINRNINLLHGKIDQLQSHTISTLDNNNKQTEELRNMMAIIKQIAEDVRK